MGCFSRRKSVTGRLVFMPVSPGIIHPPPPPSRLVSRQTVCRSFSDRKMLHKLRARQSSFSSLRPLTWTSLALLSANTSLTKPECIPLSLRSSWRLILVQISLALRAPRVLVKTTLAKMRILLELHFQSSTPSPLRGQYCSEPVDHLNGGGVDYQLSDCAASFLQ